MRLSSTRMQSRCNMLLPDGRPVLERIAALTGIEDHREGASA